MSIEQGHDLAFIVGHYKSGSTWVLRLLSLHPDVRGIGETQLFRYVAQHDDPEICTRMILTRSYWSRGGDRRAVQYDLRLAAKKFLRLQRPGIVPPREDRPLSFLDLDSSDRRELHRLLRSSRLKAPYCRDFFGFLYSRLQPNRYLLEKTPTNTRYVPLIRKVFPKARLISIIRDGRDVTISDRYHQERHGRDDWTLEKSAAGWHKTMKRHLRYVEKYNIYQLTYESLKSNGHDVVRQLLDFLELEHSPELIEDMLTRSSFEAITGRRPGEENRKRFVRKGIVGDWKNHYTDEDKALFKSVANEMLVQLGYERDTDW